MLRKSIFTLISWLIIMSVVSCAQVEPIEGEQGTLPDAQTVDVSPTGEPTDEMEVAPTSTDSTTEPVGSSGEDTTSTATLQSTATPETSTQNNEEEKSMIAQPSDTEKLVRLAKEDLAQRLGIGTDQIKTLEVREVIWPDSSLGCPEDGIVYQQVPQEGLLIRLGVGKSVYFYHSDKTHAPFLCEQRLDILKITPKVDELVPPPDSEID